MTKFLRQCGKLNFWNTRSNTDIPYMFYIKFHLPKPIFYLPSSKFTHIDEWVSISFPLCLNTSHQWNYLSRFLTYNIWSKTTSFIHQNFKFHINKIIFWQIFRSSSSSFNHLTEQNTTPPNSTCSSQAEQILPFWASEAWIYCKTKIIPNINIINFLLQEVKHLNQESPFN